MSNINKEKAYSGKYLTVRGKDYQLVPEVCDKGCKGCALYNRNTVCASTPDLISLCRQGFILKEVK